MEIAHRRVSFPSGRLILEGVLSLSCNPGPGPGVVICHPHPEYGGDMNNNVVVGIAEALTSEGFAVLRFNFRGAGLSQGSHEQGRGEVDDVAGAFSFLKSQSMVDRSRLFIAGYSFGAWVGLRAACKIENLQAAAGVAPPFGIFNFDFLKSVSIPILLVGGDQDAFCNLEEFERNFAELSSRKKKVIIKGTDHFYWGKEPEVGAAVKDFFESQLHA